MTHSSKRRPSHPKNPENPANPDSDNNTSPPKNQTLETIPPLAYPATLIGRFPVPHRKAVPRPAAAPAPARGLASMRIPRPWRDPLAAGRLLLLSTFADTIHRRHRRPPQRLRRRPCPPHPRTPRRTGRQNRSPLPAGPRRRQTRLHPPLPPQRPPHHPRRPAHPALRPIRPPANLSPAALPTEFGCPEPVHQQSQPILIIPIITVQTTTRTNTRASGTTPAIPQILIQTIIDQYWALTTPNTPHKLVLQASHILSRT